MVLHTCEYVGLQMAQYPILRLPKVQENTINNAVTCCAVLLLLRVCGRPWVMHVGCFLIMPFVFASTGCWHTARGSPASSKRKHIPW